MTQVKNVTNEIRCLYEIDIFAIWDGSTRSYIPLNADSIKELFNVT